MKKFWLFFSTFFFPHILFAADTGSLNFTPPAGDYSVVFLGNIFGVVDGILHGTGSQIMGQMFGVLNAAVLSIGGILLLYTLIVSTLNSAAQGQAFGQKWSSLWTPLRATIGIGLLVPKASGYCVMQIFVMWLVVQGVGAADKVWSAALDYLQRGGVIVQPSQGAGTANSEGVNLMVYPQDSTTASEPLKGATTMLAGQVCMLALQNLLESQRQRYVDDANTHGSGICSSDEAKSDQDSDAYQFCNNAVPNFVNTVDIYGVASQDPRASSYEAEMPSFPSSNQFYSQFNGICGSITWNKLDDVTLSTKNALGLSSSEVQTMEDSRNIAVNQMYLDLQSAAYSIVNNDPQINQAMASSSMDPASPWATQAFGVPLTSSQSNDCVADPKASNVCSAWGIPDSRFTGGAALLSGSEIQNALLDYNGIMQPTLNATEHTDQVAKSTHFITTAESQGWIMAGSYFFNLAILNQNSMSSDQDTNSGLGNSSFQTSNLTAPFDNCSDSSQPFHVLCVVSDEQPEVISDKIMQLMNGNKKCELKSALALSSGQLAPGPSPGIGMLTKNNLKAAIFNDCSNTVFGYNLNATLLVLPGQPGVTGVQFVSPYSADAQAKYQLQDINIYLGMWNIPGDIITASYNKVIKKGLQWVIDAVFKVMSKLFNKLVFPFLQSIGSLFQTFVFKLASNPTINPVLALAELGNTIINLTSTLVLTLTTVTTAAAAATWGDMGVPTLVIMVTPIVLGICTMFWTVGIMTAYYIPMLPFLIFIFGAIAWLVQVIEAMVAAPLVALGVSSPEGNHEVFGKGEQGIMMLLNVFLRPSLMIIGFIAAISLSYVGVWVLNAGFNPAMQGLQDALGSKRTFITAIFAIFFSIVIYTAAYMAITMKAFELIHILPDKVTRWIGISTDAYGQEAAGMKDAVKQEVGQQGEGAFGAMKRGIGKKPEGKKPDKDDSETKANPTDDSTNMQVGENSSD